MHSSVENPFDMSIILSQIMYTMNNYDLRSIQTLEWTIIFRVNDLNAWFLNSIDY